MFKLFNVINPLIISFSLLNCKHSYYDPVNPDISVKCIFKYLKSESVLL